MQCTDDAEIDDSNAFQRFVLLLNSTDDNEQTQDL